LVGTNSVQQTGALIWQHPTAGPVIGAVTYVNGMVVDGAGSAVEVLDAQTGHRLYSYDTGPGNLIFAASAVSGGVVITGNTAGTIYAFSVGSATSPPHDGSCPSGFTCQDIGSPSPSGSESAKGANWTVRAGGAGIGASRDSFRLVSRPTAGDVQVAADVTGQQPQSGAAQAGVMIRQSNDPGSPFYGVFVTPQGLTVEYRNAFGSPAVVANTIARPSLPLYVEIQRQGDVLQAATSTDGSNYTLVPGSTATVVMPYASLAGLAVGSGASGTGTTATFSKVIIGASTNAPAAAPPLSPCPSGWNCGDVGDPLTVGDQSASGSVWTLQGAGTGIGGRSDQFHYVAQPAASDATVSIRLIGQTGAAAAARAGLMMRSDWSANAAYYGAFLTPAGNVVVSFRDTKGLPANTLVTRPGSVPEYLEIARSGSVFTTYTSPDGVNWTPIVGSSRSPSQLVGAVLAGVAVTSGTPGAANQVTGDGFQLVSSAPPAPTICPSGWTCSDVGSPIPAGSQYLVDGDLSLLAGGKDLWGTFDEFRYVYQPLAGNATVTTHVSSQGDTDPWAKAGVMVRTSSDPSAPYFGVFVTPEGNGTVVQYRTTAGGSTTQVSGVAGDAPTYLRVVRSGSTFTAYTSSDGTNWIAYPGSTTSIPALGGSAGAGLASTSHQFVTNTTVFDGFSVTAGTPNLPAPWLEADTGDATPAGSASFSNGVFTIAGGGNDIWGTLDQAHFVYQSLTGDATITTRVAAQSDTDPWAKSGVMIKQSTTAGSPYALLAVTPGNGIAFQYGYDTNVGGGTYSAPEWLRLSRSGNVITAYSSPDGQTWTEVGSTTLTLSGPVLVGLFVCSHNSGLLNTSTFGDVTVTSP
jgi:regulation of enolase protein 1 (concanavalin A-like superfamily)